MLTQMVSRDYQGRASVKPAISLPGTQKLTFLFSNFRDGGGRRGRKRDMDFLFHLFIHSFIGWFLCVPWPGIKPATLIYWDDALSDWAAWLDSKSWLDLSRVETRAQRCRHKSLNSAENEGGKLLRLRSQQEQATDSWPTAFTGRLCKQECQRRARSALHTSLPFYRERIKYWRENLTEEIQDEYAENYKTFLRESK